jgi:2-polyprenyl-6-methoxyphenol hydroxylase-like FAD-dependent oxidoreductase
MRQVDVAIVGAGAAGAMSAAMLGRKGVSVALVDPIHPFGADFRCEKLEHAHIDALAKAGLLDEVLPAGRPYDRIWIARQGHLVEKRPMVEYGIEYSALVNTLRGLVPANVAFVPDKVVGLETSQARQTLKLAGGDAIDARLVIVASGLQADVLGAMGMSREVVSRCHSVSIGFDIVPEGRAAFDFDALTYFGEGPEHRVAYFTVFPMGDHVRANLFVYRELSDPWFKAFRADPVAAMHACMPRLRAITGDFRVLGNPRVRPVDLVDTAGCDKPGVVLIGDAYRTACPVSGTGASKAMVDAERLCNAYVPQWLRQETITAADIAQFYSDGEKQASDAQSRKVSLFAKRLALETGFGWTTYRWVRCVASMGRNGFNTVRKAFAPEKAGLQWQ